MFAFIKGVRRTSFSQVQLQRQRKNTLFRASNQNIDTKIAHFFNFFMFLMQRRTIRHDYTLMFMTRQTIRHDYTFMFVMRRTIRHDYTLIFVTRQIVRYNYKLIFVTQRTIRYDYTLMFMTRRTIRHDYTFMFVTRRTIRHDYTLMFVTRRTIRRQSYNMDHMRNGRGGACVPARTSAQRRFHPQRARPHPQKRRFYS